MITKFGLYLCFPLLLLGFATYAQPTLRDPALTDPERQELRELLRRFEPQSPDPGNLPIYEQRWLLFQLRDLAAASLLAASDTVTLTVCKTVGDPHLEEGDVVTLTKVPWGTIRMEVSRPGAAANATNPWTNPDDGGTVITIYPAMTVRATANPNVKRFTPEVIGRARVGTHPGGSPTDHDFQMRRSKRAPSGNCTDEEPLTIWVPEQHATGNRHGGHAVLD